MADGFRDIVGMRAFTDRLRGALDAAHALGVRRHDASRFEQYASILAEAAAFSYRRPFPWRDDPAKRSLFFEAASQSQQLFDASLIWPSLEPTLAKPKVHAILSAALWVVNQYGDPPVKIPCA